MRFAARIGRQTLLIRILQPRRRQKQVDLLLAPQHVEITRHDIRLLRLFHQVVQRPELMMPHPRPQRQVNQVDHGVLQFQLENQALHTVLKEVEGRIANTVTGQKRISLLAHHRHMAPERAALIFDGMRMVVPQRLGNQFRLVFPAGTVRPVIHLDQPNQVGLLLPQK